MVVEAHCSDAAQMESDRGSITACDGLFMGTRPRPLDSQLHCAFCFGAKGCGEGVYYTV